MAIKFTSSVSLFIDPILPNRVKATNAGTSAIPNVVVPVNDGMRITNNTGSTITLTSFSSLHFASTSNINIANGASYDLYIKSGASQTTGSFLITLAGYNAKTYYYSVVSTSVTTPNAFNLGVDVTDAVASDYYYSNLITISGGLTQAVNANISVAGNGSAVLQVDGGSWLTTSNLVNEGSTIQVRVTASSFNGDTTTITLNVGSPAVSDTLLVTTKVNPAMGTLIRSPHFLPLGLLEVCDFLGNLGNNLSPLYKGGSYVPNNGSNSSISTSQTNVSLAALAGVYTEISFVKARTKFYFYDESLGGNAAITWANAINSTIDPDIVMGYHLDLGAKMQYYATLTEQEGSGVSLTSGSNNPSSWLSSNLIFTVSRAVPSGTGVWRGYVTIFARHKDVPGTVISAKLFYTIRSVVGGVETVGEGYNIP
ncbi:MAG: hypothetical protein COB35_05060 [Gammaproteobacteria bacterium]|nr:MAG: hypothetical protein COB35_05060 [Gammaproteobacteria bacterium]